GDDAVYADALGRILHRHHSRKLDHAGLGRGVGDLRRAAPADAGGGSDVDDGAGALFLHHRQHVLAAEEHALEIQVDLRVPDILGHLHRAAGSRAADVIHEDVDAPELLDAGLDHGGDGLAIGDVA